jgi:hypothetical protein
MSVAARLSEHAARALRRAGWAGGLGALLAAGALVVYVTGHAAIETRREALDAEQARLMRAGTADTAARAQPAPGERLADFYAGFPPLQALPRTLTRLHTLADAHALDLERTDYRSAEEPGTPLVRVSLNLPVRGEFAQIYGWLSALLADMPEVALGALSVRRSDSEIGLVDAEVELSVFVRRAP